MTTELLDLTTLKPGEVRPADEHANLVTHGLGLVLSVLGSLLLLTLAENESRAIQAACAIYCASLVGLYAASTLSHAFYNIQWRRLFRSLDQAFIFLLIAGSFTPVAVMYLSDGWWPLLTAAMWVLALAGVAVVMWRKHLPMVAQTTYLLLGWLPVLAIDRIVNVVPVPALIWILAGGIFYTTGTLILWNDRRARYLHALWHTFVIAGSVCHYVAIVRLVAAS